VNHLIVYAHPNPDSFNHAIKEAVGAELKGLGQRFEERDLYAIDFNPAMSRDELLGNPPPEDVRREQEHIRGADMLIFIFPIWWAAMPAMMKGYFDRVFTQGFAYAMEGNTFQGLLKDKKAVLINTMGASRDEYLNSGMFKSMHKAVDEGILGFCGIEVIEHKHLCSVLDASETQRLHMLQEVRAMVGRINARQ
jgi:NAD(P)H dehydrogenase (quinone)